MKLNQDAIWYNDMMFPMKSTQISCHGSFYVAPGTNPSVYWANPSPSSVAQQNQWRFQAKLLALADLEGDSYMYIYRYIPKDLDPSNPIRKE